MNEDRLLILGNRLKLIRAEAKMKQKDFASQFGLATTTYSGYESGKHEPNIDLLIKIADKYNLSLDYVVGRSNAKEGIAQDEFNQIITDEFITPFTTEGLSKDEAIEVFAQGLENEIKNLQNQIDEFRRMKSTK